MPISGQPIGGGGHSLLYSPNTWANSQSFSSAVYANSGLVVQGTAYSGFGTYNAGTFFVQTGSDGQSPERFFQINGATQILFWVDGTGSIGANNGFFSGGITTATASHNNTPQTTMAGTTAGDVYWVQDEQGTVKRFVAVFAGYENDSTVAQTITFPTAFARNAVVSANNTGLTITASLTALTITAPNSTTLFNGVVEVTGI